MAPNTQPPVGLAAIKQAAARNGVAWQPLAAIAHHESNLNPGAVGDNGTSFGLFQLHQGGALPAGTPTAQATNPLWNANFAARAIKGLNIQGLPFAQQTYQISKRFERPTDVQGETQDANNYLRALGQQGAGQPTPATPRVPLGAGSSGVAAPTSNALSLAPLQAGLDLGQEQNQRALDALGKLSGRHLEATAAPDLSTLIQQVQTAAPVATRHAATPTVRPTATPTRTLAVPGAGGFDLPLGGKSFKPLGMPYQGTHSKSMNANSGSDNWESENAVDLGTPVGTPIYAVADGTIGSQIGSLGSGGRFAGQRVHLVTHGNEVYYAHLSKLAVNAGQQVKKGQLIGYSGEANGVAHLHIALEHGNPAKTFDY